MSLAEVAQKLGLKLNTLQKAVLAGRFAKPPKKRLRRADSGEHEKSAIRNRLRRADGSWGHGDAGTDGGQPWTAQGGRTKFNRAVDLPHGGVLLALPALLVSGLLSHTSKYFSLPAGFDGLKTIFLLLAFMSLSRIKSIKLCAIARLESGENCSASIGLPKCARYGAR